MKKDARVNTFSFKYAVPPTGWILIQRRGQYGNPPDFFSSKLWDDYVQGFGEPTKGNTFFFKSPSSYFHRVLAWLEDHVQPHQFGNLAAYGGAERLPQQVTYCHVP